MAGCSRRCRGRLQAAKFIVKTFAQILAALLFLTCNGWGGDDSSKTGKNVSAPATMQAVAMPRIQSDNSNSSPPQKSQSAPPLISFIQPAVVPHAAAIGKLTPRGLLLAAVKDAAQPKFDDVVDHALRAKSAYGFATDDDLNDAELGEPMPVYTVSQNDVLHFSEVQNMDSVLKESGHWLVPICVGGSLRSFIEVSETSNQVYQVGRASVITARVWNKMIARWPAEKNFHPKLVVYPGIPGYFFTIPEVQPANMTDTVMILAEVDKPASLSPAKVTFRSWR